MIRTPTKASAPMNKAEAKAITQRIRAGLDDAAALAEQARDRKAWKALGYDNWGDYVNAEFGFSRQRFYQLLDQGKVRRELAAATGDLSTSVDISEAAARDIKPVLEETKAEIKTRVTAGEKPEMAVTETVAAMRAEKERQRQEREAGQAKNDAFREQHAAELPQAVKDHQQATAEWRAKSATGQAEASSTERVADLEQEVTALNGVIAALKEENAWFSDMRVQFDQGGFKAVFAGKDEEIRVLKARLVQESEDKAGWAKKAKAWQKRALDLGWSNDLVIQVQPSSDEVIHLD